MKVTVIIPVLNEGAHLADVLASARQHVDEIIVVDDGSSEEQAERIRQASGDAVVLRHLINLGKGAALRTGVEAAIERKADIVVLMDGDGQHLGEDNPKLVSKLTDENLDIVFGSRLIGTDMPFVMMFGNKFLSVACSLLFGLYVSDTQSGFRAFRTSIYPQLRWSSPRYAVETEIIVNAARRNLRIGEVPIQTIYLDKYKGTTIIDGLRIFGNMLLWKLR
jgi:glycosyltransferase involved in cell wall biosynthesis